MIKMKKNKKKGFTLIELIVVIAILGILAAVLVPQILSYSDGARRSRAASDCKVILNAVQVHNSDLTTPLPNTTTVADLKTDGVISSAATATVKAVPSDINDNATLADLEIFSNNSNSSDATDRWASNQVVHH